MPQDGHSSFYKYQERIHRELYSSVKVFRYWASNVKIYHDKVRELDSLEEQLKADREQQQYSLRASTDLSTHNQAEQELHKMISRYLKPDSTQSQVTKKFLDSFSKSKVTEGSKLGIEHFKDITPLQIDEICNGITFAEDKSSEKDSVKPETIKKNINDIKKNINNYQESLRSVEMIKDNIKSLKEKHTQLNIDIKTIENGSFNVGTDKTCTTPIKSKSYDKQESKESPGTRISKQDSTNFVAAEIGFLIEISGTDYRYYHYPVTFPRKNTFNIYDLENESFAHITSTGARIQYGNHITDRSIVNGAVRKQSDPCNDYHSEAALFLLMRQPQYQQKLIELLSKDIKRDKIPITKLPKLIIEMHSTNDMCSQCFSKAKYLVDWQEENLRQKQAKSGPHFLEYFRNKLLKTFNITKKSVTDHKEAGDLEVEINYTYSDDYSKSASGVHPKITKTKIKPQDMTTSLLSFGGEYLCKYSLITSGGSADIHKNYAPAYNKAVEKKYAKAQVVIKNAWQKNIIIKSILETLKTRVTIENAWQKNIKNILKALIANTTDEELSDSHHVAHHLIKDEEEKNQSVSFILPTETELPHGEIIGDHSPSET